MLKKAPLLFTTSFSWKEDVNLTAACSSFNHRILRRLSVAYLPSLYHPRSNLGRATLALSDWEFVVVPTVTSRDQLGYRLWLLHRKLRGIADAKSDQATWDFFAPTNKKTNGNIGGTPDFLFPRWTSEVF